MKIAVLFAFGAALLAWAVWIDRPCRPGDRGVTIGTVMVVGGCR